MYLFSALGPQAARPALPSATDSGDEGQADQAVAVDQAVALDPVHAPVDPLQAGGLQVSFQQLIVID